MWVFDENCYSFTTPQIPDFFTELFTGGNDLDNLKLSFEPNDSVDFYFGCTESITELPTDPAGGTPLNIGEDQFVQVNITGGHTVRLYGVSYSSFFVSDNGYITFNTGDGSYTESLALHFDRPRISALYDDLSVDNPPGAVSWQQFDDRVVVSYVNVPEYSATNSNTFQFEMYFDGRITISFLAIAATDGVAGLSEGVGLSPDYYPSDLSGQGACRALVMSLPNGVPDLTPPDAPLVLDVRIRNGSEVYVPGSGTVYYRMNGGAFTSAPLSYVSGEDFQAVLPAPSCGEVPEFYFSATGSLGTVIYLPPAGATTPLSTQVAVRTVLIDDNFESDLGWTVFNDATLTSGAWGRGVPVAAAGAPPGRF